MRLFAICRSDRTTTWILVLCLLGITAPARAQDESERDRQLAKSLVDDALRDYENRNYRKAQAQFEAAYRVYPSEKLKYSLGKVYEAQELWLQAISAYEDYLAGVPEAERRQDRTDEVRAAITHIASRLGRLTVVGPPTTRFRLDGGTERPLPAKPIWVTPGPHQVRTPSHLREILVPQGGALTVELPPPPTVSPPAPAPPLPDRPFRAPKWIMGGLGLALAAAGGALWPLVGVEAGAPVLAVGAGVMGSSGVMFGLDARPPARTALLSMGGRF